MASVDQRIVQMVFDNSKFESAVKVTINTLDNLKKNLKLDSASDAFSKLTKAAKDVDFSSLEDDVSKVADRFSSLGIVGMTVLQNITTAAMNAGKSLVNALVSPLIEGGKRRALNIEQAKFQIEGLGYAWEDVAGDISYAVDGTAYGLDVAAKAAGQLLASNVAVGDSMKQSLRGISGVAAMTGREYEDISRIFTTVAGNGRLMGDQLLQLSSSGINAAATLAKYLGVTEAEVREMTSKGLIDFATFAAAMDDAFGEHSKEANKTFTGSLSNMKAALARIGAEFATPAYANLIDVNNALKNSFNAVKTALDPVIKSAASAMEIVKNFVVSLLPQTEDQTKALAAALSGPLAKANEILVAFGKSVWNLFTAVTRVMGPIASAFKEALGGTLLDILIRAAQMLETFTSQLILSDRMTENLRKTFVGIFTVLGSVLDILSQVVFAISGAFLTAVTRVFGFFLDILLRVTAFLGDVVLAIRDFINYVLELDVVKSIFETIGRIIQTFGSIVSTVGNFVHEFANSLLDSAFTIALDIFNALAVALEFILRVLNNVIIAVKDWIVAFKNLPVVQKTLEQVRKVITMMRDNSSELVSVVKSKLVSAFNTARSALSSFISSVKDLISQYIEIPTLQEVVAKVQEMVTEAFEKSVEIFKKVAEFVGKVTEKLKELTGDSIHKAIENFGKLRDKIVELIDVAGKIQSVKDAFEVVTTYLGSFVNGTSNIIEVVKNNLLDFINWIKEKFSSVTLGEVIAAGAGGTAIAFFIQLTRLLGSLKNFSDSVTGIISSINKVPKAIAGFFDALSEKVKADKKVAIINAIKEVIQSVALLAGALAILANMDQGAVTNSAVVLGVLAGALVGLTAAMSYLLSKINPVALAETTGMLIGISGSLMILVLSLKVLTTVDMDGILLKVGVLGLIMLELAAAAIAMNKLTDIFGGGVGVGQFIGIAVAVGALVLALKVLSSIEPGRLLAGLTALTVIMGELIALMAVASIAGKSAEKATVSIGSIGVALLLMTLSIKIIGGMDPGQAIAGIAAITILMADISILMMASYFAGKNADKAARAIVSIGIALNLIAVALRILSGMSVGDIAKGMAVVTGVVALFTLFTGITHFAGKNADKAGQAIMTMSIGMIAIAGAIAILSAIDPSGLARATIAVDSVIGMFALLTASTKNSVKASENIKMFTVAIVALSGAMAVLSLIDPVNLAAAAASIDSVILVFSLLVSSNVSGISVKATGTIGLMIVAVGALAGLLAALANLGGENVLSAGIALSSVMVSLTAMSAVLTLLGQLGAGAITGALYGIAAMGIVVAGLTTLLAGLGWLANNIKGMKENLEAAMDVLGYIGGAIGSFLGNLAGQFMSGVSQGLADLGTNLSNFITNLQPFIDGIKSIDDSTMSSMNTLISMVTAMAAADFLNTLTTALGGSGGDAINSLSDNLPKFGEALVEFGNALKQTNVDDLNKGAQAAKALAEMANNIPREGGIFTILGSVDMEGFGTQLVAFGKCLVDYGNIVENVKADAINASVPAAQGLVDLSNSLKANEGIIPFIAGMNNMETFGTQIAAFGRSLVMYGNTVENVKADAINASIPAAQGIVDVSNSLKSNEGIVPFIAGQTNMATFGTQIAAFGRSLVMYGNEVDNVKADAIIASIPAVQGLVEVSNSLQGGGGVIEWWTGGQHNMEQFGQQLSAFGGSLKSFSNSLTNEGGVNVGKIIEVIPGVQALVDIANLVSSGQFDDFQGKATNFRLGANNLALALIEFQNGMGNTVIDVGAITSSVEALNTISNAAAVIAASGDIYTTAGESLKLFGENYAQFAASMNETELSAEVISAVVEAITILAETLATVSEGLVTSMTAIKETFTGLAQSIMTEFVNIFVEGAAAANEAVMTFVNGVIATIQTGFAGATAAIQAAGLAIINALATGLGNFSVVNAQVSAAINSTLSMLLSIAPSFTQVGVSMVRNIANGITSSQSIISNLLNNILNQARSNATNIANQFKSVGVTIINALINGMNSKKSSVSSAFRSIVANASNNYSTSWFYDAGAYCMQGFINGMNSKANAVANTANAIASSAAAAINSALQIKSPSRVTMKTGVYFVQGLIKGIKNTSDSLYSSVVRMASETVGRTEAVLQTIGDTIDNELDFEPTITPILDSSKLSTGFNNLPAFSDLSYAFVGMNQGSNRFMQQLSEIQNGTTEMLEMMNDKIEDIVSDVNGILNKEAITDLYIDGKKLASATAKPMNRQLGSMMRRGGIAT